MGLTERHWFENEDVPENYEWALEDAVLKEQEVKEQISDAIHEMAKEFRQTIVRCKDCKQGGIDPTSYPQYWCSAHSEYHDAEWFCADGERKKGR